MPITSAPPMSAPKTSAATRKASGMTAARTEALNGLGQLAQIPLISFKQYADAAAIGTYWPNIAKEVAVLAETQEEIARIIDPLLKAGPYTGLVMAVLPFALQLAVNHKMMAPGIAGTVSPEALAAQMELAVANQQLEATRQQMEAERQTAKLRQELQDQRDKVNGYANTEMDADLT